MKLYNPTKVYFEKDCAVNHGREITGRHILILTGRNSAKANHSLDDVLAGIGPGVEVSVFDEVESDPTIETVVRAAAQNRAAGIDFCVGVGGGSAIDAAKAVAVLLANEENADLEKLFYADRNAVHLPIAAVPTTCGTGSEVTPFSVLTDSAQGTKRTIFSQLYPQLALIDPRYLETIPYRTCVSTCVDALAHLIEAYMTTRANNFNRFYSITGLRLFREFKDFLKGPEYFERIDDAVREKMMACAMFGGYAIATNGSGLPHGLANSITHELQLAHGRSVILFIPGFLRYYQDQTVVAEILKLLGYQCVDELEDDLYAILGCVPVPEDLWNREIDKMLSNAHKLSSYPFQMTEDILRRYPGKLFRCI